MGILWPCTEVKLILIAILRLSGSTDVPDFGTIDCIKNLVNLGVPNTVKEFTVECPRFCLDSYCIVRGSQPYTSSSSVCCASIHNGVLENKLGGSVWVEINYNSVPHAIGSYQNGIKSRDYLGSVVRSFYTKKVPQKSQKQQTNRTQTRTATEATVPLMSQDTVDSDVEEKFIELQELTATTTSAIRSTSSRSVHTTSDYRKEENTIPNVLPDQTTDKLLFLGFNNIFLMIGILIAVFAAGVLSSVIFFVCKKCRRRHGRSGLRSHTGRGSKKRSMDSRGAVDVCVCYENLNTSKQALLTDPETCDRPCPIRQPLTHDSLVYEASMLEEKPVMPDQCCTQETDTSCSRSNDDCALACSSKCNPSQYDF